MQACSGYYSHAASFGSPPTEVRLESGHRGVVALAAGLTSGTLQLGPGNVADVLQAASYLQVAAVLGACSAWLLEHALNAHPGLTLRVALDLGLASLAGQIEREFLREYFMHCGERAAALLREWPPAKRRELLSSPELNASTECCLIETLCHLAKLASSAEAVALLDCVQWQLLRASEAAAITLYLQHNAKWVDRRLSTAAAWRLLNARTAADVKAIAAHGSAAGRRLIVPVANGTNGMPLPLSGLRGEHGARAVRQRTVMWGLSTGTLASWHGTVMPCSTATIECACIPRTPDGRVQPMVLQLEREDPRHAAAEAVSGVTGGGGAASAGGSGWDLQLSMDPHQFPAGFQATCWAFGSEGLFWCKLGPLVKPGPTWWKVGFLASQLPRALPTRLLLSGGPSSGGGGGDAACDIGHSLDDDGLLLVGCASASPATDIPADARDELLEVISAQLDAAGSATAVLPAAAGPGTWCFSIDVSSSMGSSHSWQPGAVSRLCFALASLACVVDAKVAPGDWVTVQAFDAEQATLKPWFRKPALFDRAAFLAEVTGEVRACGLSRYGTATCTAVEEAVLTLAEKVDSLAEPQRSASSGSGAGELGAAHSLVLLTDGMAADEGYAFHWAADLLRDPPFEDGGFKALLLHIADNGRSSRCLANLAADTSGAPLEYVQVLRLQMGASLNLTPLPATVPSHRQDAAADSRRERDWRSAVLHNMLLPLLPPLPLPLPAARLRPCSAGRSGGTKALPDRMLAHSHVDLAVMPNCRALCLVFACALLGVVAAADVLVLERRWQPTACSEGGSCTPNYKDAFVVQRIYQASDANAAPQTGCTGGGGLKRDDLDASDLDEAELECAYYNATAGLKSQLNGWRDVWNDFGRCTAAGDALTYLALGLDLDLAYPLPLDLPAQVDGTALAAAIKKAFGAAPKLTCQGGKLAAVSLCFPADAFTAEGTAKPVDCPWPAAAECSAGLQVPRGRQGVGADCEATTEGDSGTSTGAMVGALAGGIVAGVVAGLAAFGGGYYWWTRRRTAPSAAAAAKPGGDDVEKGLASASKGQRGSSTQSSDSWSEAGSGGGAKRADSRSSRATDNLLSADGSEEGGSSSGRGPLGRSVSNTSSGSSWRLARAEAMSHGDKKPAAWPPANRQPDEQLATFAGGCFWSVELAFQRVPGVVATCSGYAQGHADQPTYEQVCSGRTGHTEAVQLTYKPAEVSFDQLCDAFLAKIDPKQKNGQGGDIGTQYRTGIYWHTDEQEEVAQRRLAAIPGCAVEAEPFRVFWPAEEYHQRYLEKGGRFGRGQCAAKGCNDPIRCYG
ncbi:peptide methionine sulfoxide reductase [Chlorella sorokiniana]|uniref:peptide-methionine (S)-S-oxide reductase n=1 Tax=Chlorella sorokiniana TaxID=3076 RepID=A0A2P6TU18_CHLSO|nr:peptide methionine sulfoxide reductase [Chlorella sorokiniana]|eukprot:PRW57568.1 peptide methionine sulfoxide reductase [Chlorella sorokiniana]